MIKRYRTGSVSLTSQSPQKYKAHGQSTICLKVDNHIASCRGCCEHFYSEILLLAFTKHEWEDNEDKKNSLICGGLYQNKAVRIRNGTHWPQRAWLRGGRPACSLLRAKIRGQLVRRRRMASWRIGFKFKKTDSKKVCQAIGEIYDPVVKEMGPQPPCSISSFLLSARNHFFSPNTSALKSSFHSYRPWGEQHL